MIVLFFAYICTLKTNQKTIYKMKKIFATLMLATVCTLALGQNVKDSLWDDDMKDLKSALEKTKWEPGMMMGFTYDYSFNAPNGLSNNGFGLDISLLEMKWKGWDSGSFTLGILDFIIDWQYLLKGYAFDGLGGIYPATEGKGHRADFFFGFPVGINQQFGDDFGITLQAVPGVGFYSYRNENVLGGVHREETLYPVKGRVGFRLNLKAILWYSDFGVIVRYQPLASKDMDTTMLSIGIAFRN